MLTSDVLLQSLSKMKNENDKKVADDTSDSEDEESSSNDSGSDSSEASSSETNEALKVSYHLSHEKAVSLQKHYICHMCGST